MTLQDVFNIFKTPQDSFLFLYLLAHADKDGNVGLSIRQIASELGMTRMAVQRGIERIVGTKLGQKGACPTNCPKDCPTHIVNGGISICNIDSYSNLICPKDCPKPCPKDAENVNNIQDDGTKVGQKKKDINDRKNEFYDSLIPYVGKYPKEMIREFFDYWSEMNRSKTKMRFEQEKTWETPRRLVTWANRNKKTKNDIGVVLRGTKEQEQEIINKW